MISAASKEPLALASDQIRRPSLQSSPDVAQVVLVAARQTNTLLLRLAASDLANERSATKPFTSLVSRVATRKLLKLGAAMARSTASTVIVIISSITVKPRTLINIPRHGFFWVGLTVMTNENLSKNPCSDGIYPHRKSSRRFQFWQYLVDKSKITKPTMNASQYDLIMQGRNTITGSPKNFAHKAGDQINVLGSLLARMTPRQIWTGTGIHGHRCPDED